jgi:hypothetical protein
MDDLIGAKIVQTAYIDRRFDDHPLYGILVEDGRVWFAGGSGSVEQEEQAFIELGLWTEAEAKLYHAEQAEAERAKAKARLEENLRSQEANERATYERLRQKFEGKDL